MPQIQKKYWRLDIHCHEATFDYIYFERGTKKQLPLLFHNQNEWEHIGSHWFVKTFFVGFHYAPHNTFADATKRSLNSSSG